MGNSTFIYDRMPPSELILPLPNHSPLDMQDAETTNHRMKQCSMRALHLRHVVVVWLIPTCSAFFFRFDWMNDTICQFFCSNFFQPNLYFFVVEPTLIYVNNTASNRRLQMCYSLVTWEFLKKSSIRRWHRDTSDFRWMFWIVYPDID